MRGKRGYQAIDVYNVVKRKIVTMELKPGEILREKALERDLGVGRTPIREAILALKAENLVESRPNESPFVKEITLKGVKDFFEPFMVIEKLTSRLAALRITAEQLVEIRKVNKSVSSSIKKKDYLNIWSKNRHLHVLIAGASDNEHLISIQSNLRDKAERLAYLAISEELRNNTPLEEHLNKMDDQHEEIISRLEAKDVDGSEALAEEHAKLFQHRITMYLGANIAL